MTDLILHKNKKYIEEDLDYYFSSQRDVNNQIRPTERIYSLTPESNHFCVDFCDEQIGSLFIPIAPYSVDRIYIGISFPLFANNWGTAFLRYLITRVKPQGSVILPVYPEMQAGEKNFWSRSLLENNFLSRSRWKGISNIWAENDGVMSIRIGRKFPPETNSTLSYFFQEASNIVLRKSLSRIQPDLANQNLLYELGQQYWQAANTYAIIEKIIYDNFGMKAPLLLCDIGSSNGLLAIESLLSKYINVSSAVSYISDDTATHPHHEVINRFQTDIENRFHPVFKSATSALNFQSSYNVVCAINTAQNCVLQSDFHELLASAVEKLLPGGILIVYEQNGLTEQVSEVLSSYKRIQYYSSIVASPIDDKTSIAHYSRIIEGELASENKMRKNVFRVIKN